MNRPRTLHGRKVLVASLGVAAVNYAVACNQTEASPPTAGNLMPTPEVVTVPDAGTQTGSATAVPTATPPGVDTPATAEPDTYPPPVAGNLMAVPPPRPPHAGNLMPPRVPVDAGKAAKVPAGG